MDKIEIQTDNLVQKIKHHLITTMGRVWDEATDEEFYRAFCFAFREEIMINWAATSKTIDQNNSRMIYYFSMEYLPGRILGNNITNLHSQELVQRVVKKMGFSLEQLFSCEKDPGLGNGGLGRLASCFLDSLATQQYPAQGYGLRYQYGTFAQEIWDGMQVERPDRWLINANPWEFRRDQRAMIIKFCGQMESETNLHGDRVYNLKSGEEVRALAYDVPIIGYNEGGDFSVNTLRLWSTKESPRNFEMQRFNAGQLGQAAENTTLTDVLYPNDNHDAGKRIRLKQEFLLVSASLQDIIRHHLSIQADFADFEENVRIQINDTHPALVVAELMRILTKEQTLSWGRALEITRNVTSYTNHTVLVEALEKWNQNRMRHLLPRQYEIIERLNLEFCNKVRKSFPDDEERVRRMSIIEDGQVRMAHLALVGSHKVNGVAALHSKILKESLFRDFYEMSPEMFTNVTNGVTQRRWLLHCNPKLAAFISKRIGKEWITEFSNLRKLESFAHDEQSQQELLQIKQENKNKLLDYLKEENFLRDHHGKKVGDPLVINPTALFDVQVKRIHEYKRQLMNILHVIMLYHDLLEDPSSRRIDRCVIIGGKAAAGYDVAKAIIRFIYCVARKINNDSRIQNKLKVVFLENYNVSQAELVIPAADLSEQISTAGMEASGTGNMKLSINGAMTIGTEDGANIEMRQEVTDQWWPFSFGCKAHEIAKMKQELSYDPSEVYSHHPKVERAVETLRDRSFAENDGEHNAFSELYYKLMEHDISSIADPYFVLKDLPEYYETQKRVESFYCDKEKWAEYVLHNIAGMGTFSSDVSIAKYAKEIWGLQKLPPNKEILRKVRQDYTEHDKCRILAL